MKKRIITALLLAILMLSACSSSKETDVKSIKPGTEQYRQIAERNIEAALANSFGIQSVNDESVDLQACAEDYLKNIGLNAEEITALKGSLSKEY